MRLFIAVNFNEKTKDHLVKIQEKITGSARKSHPSRRENLHLTLAFLGDIETEKIEDLKRILETMEFSPMELKFSAVGTYPGRDGDIYWVGLEENVELLKLQKRLTHQLRTKGFRVDGRPFAAHITLARNTVLKKDLSAFEDEEKEEGYSTKVDTISLMLSHQTNSRLTYTELYKKKAGGLSRRRTKVETGKARSLKGKKPIQGLKKEYQGQQSGKNQEKKMKS